jgi:GPH family glycoside/pentoside/hexuronide:cation symporter
MPSAICFASSSPIQASFSMSSKGIFVVVLVGQFIKNAGAIPCVYIWMSLVADVLDHLEWKAGFRCDGITVGINSIFALFMPILGNAIINLLLGNYGYIVPVEGQATQTAQNTTLQIIFDGCAVGAEVISSVIIVCLMLFLNVEKNLAQEQAEIQERNKQEALASGGVWIAPEEKAKQEEEEFDKETTAMELQELQAKCEKKHLNYDEEKAKYDAKKAKKAAKEQKQ